MQAQVLTSFCLNCYYGYTFQEQWLPVKQEHSMVQIHVYSKLDDLVTILNSDGDDRLSTSLWRLEHMCLLSNVVGNEEQYYKNYQDAHTF